MSLLHAFTSGKTAAADTTVVDGPNWDADHVITGGNLGALLYQGTAGAPTLINSVAAGQVLASAGAGSAPAWSASPALTAVLLGSDPATAGSVRVANATTAVAARNSSNTNNLHLVSTDSSNRLQIGDDGTLGAALASIVLKSTGAGGVYLQFGGATSSFPMLTRSGTTLRVRLGDDTNYADLESLNITVDAAGLVAFSGRTRMSSAADGRLLLTNQAGTDFARIQFGGTSSSFPALKRNGAALDVRLADDTNYADLGVGNITATGNVLASSDLRAGAARFIYFSTRATMSSPADSVLLLQNAAVNDFNRLQFGGTTASFPSLKRSSTVLQFKLADDSAFSPFQAGPSCGVAADTATPAGGSTNARLIFGTTAGFGIYYGSGLPTVSAGQGSLYLRSDGSSTSTRLYVNTDGGTTWTNFTSAA